MATQYAFAPGHDNTAGLRGLHELQPPLFKLYRLDLKCRWHAWTERIRTADGRFVGQGLPWIEITFPVLSAAEKRLLRTTFFAAGEESAPITVRTLNDDLEAYLIYNGWMHWPETLERDRGHYRDVLLVVDHVQLRSGFSSGFDPLGFGV
ncbi:MAG: hypothetical protein Kow00120_00260 [Anaerolineae bacterium]